MGLTKDLVNMMYGFGDAETPYKESVEIVEQLVTQYIESLCRDALSVHALRRSAKLDTECFIFAVRSQPAKFKRVMVRQWRPRNSPQELLDMRRRLKEVRRIDHGLDEP